MGFWDDVVNQVDSLQKQLEAEVEKIQNQDFPPAVMAAVALTVKADGAISAEEKRSMGQFITSHPLLQKFDALAMRDQFFEFCEQLKRDDEVLQLGDEACVKRIVTLKGKPSESRSLVRMMVSVGNADGHFDDNEKKVVRRVCLMLDINPAEFEL